MSARAWCAAAVAVAVVAAPAAGQDPRVAKVLADWKARQQAVDAVRYVVRGKKITPAGAQTDDLGRPKPGLKDVVIDRPLVFHIDFATGRYRLEDREQGYSDRTGEYYPSLSIGAFDGTTYRVAAPRAENSSPGHEMAKDRPDLTEITGDLRREPILIELNPFFYGHGIVRVHDDKIYPGHLRRDYNPDLFVFHADGVLDGRRCVVVRTRPEVAGRDTFVEEFWTDPARGSAVLRHTTLRDGQSFLDFRVEQQQTPPGWFPRRWEFTILTGGQKARAVGRYEVESIEFGRPPADDDVRFEVRPGMLVSKLTHRPLDAPIDPGQDDATYAESFRVGEDGRFRPEESPYAAPPPARRWWWSAWVYAAGLAGAAVVVGLVVRRGRRATRPAA